MTTPRFPILACIALPLLLASCGPSSNYAGIDLTAQPLRMEDRYLQSLASRAQAGDKQAQLRLGTMYEKGFLVPRDLKQAKKLYKAAASDSGGTIWVYSPPVGNGTSGRVIPVDTGAKQNGLAEAKARLAALEGAPKEASGKPGAKPANHSDAME